MIRIINAIGPEHVVAVVTDNAAACKKAGEIVMRKFSHIYWQPCIAHVMDLLLEDICKMDWAKGTIEDCRAITTFVTNHQWSDALVRQKAKMPPSQPGAKDGGSGLELLKPGGCCACMCLHVSMCSVVVDASMVAASALTTVNDMPRAGATRFASEYINAERLIKMEGDLAAAVSDAVWEGKTTARR